MFWKSSIAAAFVSLSTLTTSGAATAGSTTPGPYTDYVRPYGDEVYIEVFDGGRPATIILDGDCRSDIDLWVYDEYDNLVAKSTSYGCYEQIDFYPMWTGEFSIVVENHGKPYGSSYVLETF